MLRQQAIAEFEFESPLVELIMAAAADVVAGNVQTRLSFRTFDTLTLPFGFGLGPLNATIATALSPLTDVLFGAGFTMFLMDSNHAIDITPVASRRRSCSQGIDVRGGQTCERVVFLVAGLDQVAPQAAMATGFPEADTWVIEDTQGYVLNFTEGNRNWGFDNATECRVYHTAALATTIGAIRLCVKNTAPNNLQARTSIAPSLLLLDADTLFAGITSCPYSDPLNQDCLQDVSWHSLPGWTTDVKTTLRNASVAYSRLNGTIFSHTFTEELARSAPVDSSEILQAWDNFLATGTSADDQLQLALSILGGGYGKFLFPGMVAWYLNSITAIAADNPAADTRGVNALHALLAIPLYYCQTGALERAAMPSLPSSVFLDGDDAVNSTGDTGTRMSLAMLRNEVFVSRATLVAYVLLSTATLLLCFVALGIGSLTSRAKRIPETTSFPVLDFCTNCVVIGPDGSATASSAFCSVKERKGAEKMRKLNRVKVGLVTA